jgi:hypothetical protein
LAPCIEDEGLLPDAAAVDVVDAGFGVGFEVCFMMKLLSKIE